MKGTLIGGFFVVVLLVGILSCASAPAAEFSGGPRISFDKDSVDLGKVPLDIPINYAFRFKNVGNAPLNIINTSAKVLVGC